MSTKKRVFYRIFPTEKIDLNYVKLDLESQKIYVRHLQELSRKSMNSETSYWDFQTDGIFLNSTQESVYKRVEEGVLQNVLNGNNAIIMSFGQTRSGKTFTTSGLQVTEQEFGILPRVAKDLFELKKQEPKNIKISILMSYAEFYNTYAVDLLGKSPDIIETYKCKEVRKIKVINELEALKSIFIGEGRKNFIQNKSSYLSNLATSVATFHIIRRDMDLSNPIKTRSRLHIVDMAGNDSCGNLHNFYKNPKQIGLANVTKSQLEQFVLCLKENIPETIRIKQRTNSLIYYLNGDFSEQTILRFIGHIKLNCDDLIITLSMLRFGNIVRGLKMKRSDIQFDVNEEIQLAYLKNKLESFEREMYLNSVLLNQNLISGLDKNRIAHLKKVIDNYLGGRINEITLMNVADAQLVLQNVKEICGNYQNDINKLKAEKEAFAQQQQQSNTSLKHKNSRSSSHSSVSKLSRKSSKIKSKESVVSKISKEKRLSASMESEQRIKVSVSDDRTAATETSQTSSKRKKSLKSANLAFVKHSAQSKRRSSNTSIDKRDSKSSIRSSHDGQLPIPDIVPEKQDMWRRFTNNSGYKERLEEYKENEKDVRSNFVKYIKEVKKMQNCRDAIDKHSNDLIMAQTFRKFNSKDVFDETGKLVISFAEKQCKDILEASREELLQQQETVLTAQATLKIYLENRRAISKRVEEEFDQFCMENYRVPSADLEPVQDEFKPYTYEIDFEHADYDLEPQEEILCIPKVPDTTQIVRNLQKLMMHERHKMKQIVNKKKNEWKNV